jgi:hypothetical protein
MPALVVMAEMVALVAVAAVEEGVLLAEVVVMVAMGLW